MRLTFYMFKESVTELNQVVKAKKLRGADRFVELPTKSQLPFPAKAYIQANRRTTPKWLRFLQSHFELNAEEIGNTSNSFVLLMKVSGRIFAVTMGYGHAAIDRDQLEPNFGLRVTLNEVDPDKIRQINSRTIESTTRSMRVNVSRDSALYDFGIDVEQGMISQLSGLAKDPALASKISGSDSLFLNEKHLTLASLGTKCEALLQSFQKIDYRERFPSIDNSRLVKEKTLRHALDELLLAALHGRNGQDRLMLAYPHMDDWTSIESYRISRGYRQEDVEDVDLEAIYSFADMHHIRQLDPRKIRIWGLNQDGQPITESYPLYQFVVFEPEYQGTRYILNAGHWYELDADYIARMDSSVRAIPEIDDPGFLPGWRHGQSEDEYNDAVVQQTDYLLLHRESFQVSGYSRVEVCDLLSPRSEFVCVKKYNSSSTLSHLFQQALVSAQMLTDSRKYREFVLAQCEGRWNAQPSIDLSARDKIVFVFAIASKSSERLAQSLPFFSKVALRQATTDIRRMGYVVKLFKIPYTV